MTKLAKLIRLVNLLSGPTVVSLNRICRTCEIAPRTAYRYLNHISEASVPVYFDHRLRGYRLSLPKRMKFDGLPIGDVVLLACALALIRRHVNEGYQQDFQDLLTRLKSTQDSDATDLLDDIVRRLAVPKTLPDHSSELTIALVEAAVANQRPIVIDSIIHGQETRRSRIDNPTLRFGREWGLLDASADTTATQELKTMLKAKIVERS